MSPLKEVINEFEFPFALDEVQECRITREFSYGIQLEVTTNNDVSYIVEIQEGHLLEISRIFITKCDWKQLKRKS